MAYPCQIRGFLTNRLVLFMVAVTCLHPDSTKGNSVVVLEQPSGEFQSPGYPDLDDDMHCTWKIIAPPYHRITITFLDFELVERSICNDEVEIYDSNTKRGTYRGTQLHSQSILSNSNIILVVLISCSTSLLSDRKGIHVSYSTVYPTTLKHETSKRATTTRQTTSTSVATTVNGPFSSQSNNMLSTVADATPTSLTLTQLHTRLLPLNNNSEQVSPEGSGTLIGALLGGLIAIVIFTIIIIFIVKRMKGPPLNANTGDSEVNQEHDDLSSHITEGATEDSCQLEYDYVQGSELQNANNFNVSLDRNRGETATKIRSSKIQKKSPISNTSNDLCVYKNNASNAYDNTDFEEEYNTVSCIIQQASPRVHNNDRQLEPKDLDMNLDEGIVINNAYEPYLPQT